MLLLDTGSNVDITTARTGALVKDDDELLVSWRGTNLFLLFGICPLVASHAFQVAVTLFTPLLIVRLLLPRTNELQQWFKGQD